MCAKRFLPYGNVKPSERLPYIRERRFRCRPKHPDSADRRAELLIASGCLAFEEAAATVCGAGQ
jgi:hypothetical protein